MKKILIATKNLWKFWEIREALQWLDFEFLSLVDLWINEDIEETGKTYEENAKLKAEFFWKMLWLTTIADDSWIKVEALKWELWVKTRRWWAWEKATDREWVDFFLKRMEKEQNRNAEFFTSIAFFNWKETIFFKGSCIWKILKEQDWPLIPWIPLTSYFVPNWYNTSYCNLWIDEKNKISHRWQASLKLRDFLLKNEI